MLEMSMETAHTHGAIEQARLRLEYVTLRVLIAMAVLSVGEIKKVLNVPAMRGRRRSRFYSKGVRKPKGGWHYYHSNPGEPPRKITGQLQRRVAWDKDSGNKTVKVGVLKLARPYPRYLEQGTKKMAVRPYLVSTILKLVPKFKRLVAEGNFTQALRRIEV